MKSNTNLEPVILDAAAELFLERGFDSTSTTDIAKKAGCNQALVHYYFRTKENLFLRIFKKNIETFLSFANNYMYSGDFMQFLEKGIESYFEILKANRSLPLFLIKELAMNEDRRIFFRENFVNNELRRSVYYKFDKIVKQEIEKGTIRPIETLNLLLDVISLCAFTFISLPMYATWLEKDDSEVDDFIESRKNEIITLIKNGLTR